MKNEEFPLDNENLPKYKKTQMNNYLPIVIFQSYLTFTVFFFFFGPWPWPIKNTEKLLLLLISCQFMLALGYYIGVKTKKIMVRNNDFSFGELLKFCLLLSIMVLIPEFYSRTSILLFDINSLFSGIVNGVINPGDQYMRKILSYGENSSSTLLTIFTIIVSPVKWILLPVTLCYWKSVKFSFKITFIMIIIIDTLSWIIIGTNKGLFDIVIIYISYLMIRKTGLFAAKKTENSQMKLFAMFAFLGLMLVIALSYFTNAIESRMGGIGTYNAAANISVDEEALIYKASPDSLKETTIALGAYITQGYYGLSLALDESFSPTLGLGNSMFITSFIDERFGIDFVKENSYPYKIEAYGWDRFANWHSIYTWFASDVTFFGLPFLMFILGYFLSVIWKDILFNKNPFAISIFSMLTMLFFYIPANNQIFSFPHTLFSFYVLLFVWYFEKRIRVRFI